MTKTTSAWSAIVGALKAVTANYSTIKTTEYGIEFRDVNNARWKINDDGNVIGPDGGVRNDLTKQLKKSGQLQNFAALKSFEDNLASWENANAFAESLWTGITEPEEPEPNNKVGSMAIILVIVGIYFLLK